MILNDLPINLRTLLLGLMVFGSLAWGILGLTNFNLVSRLARSLNIPILSRLIYVTIGLSAILYVVNYTELINNPVIKFPGQLLTPSILPQNYNLELTLPAPARAKHLIYWVDEENQGVSKVTNQQAQIRLNHSGQPVIKYRWASDSFLGPEKCQKLN